MVKLSSVALDRKSTDAACNHPVEVAWSLFQTSNAAEVLDTLSLVLVCGMGEYRSDAVKETLRKQKATFVSYCLAGTTLDTGIRSTIVQLQEPLSDQNDGIDYKRLLEHFCQRRRLFRTASGRFGLGSSAMRPEDICCILFGAPVPYVIRRCEQAFKLVGECYIHGVMRGEIVAEEHQQQRGVEEIVFT